MTSHHVGAASAGRAVLEDAVLHHKVIQTGELQLIVVACGSHCPEGDAAEGDVVRWSIERAAIIAVHAVAGLPPEREVLDDKVRAL